MRRVPIADDPDTWEIPDEIKARQRKPLVEQLAEAARKVDWAISMGAEGYE